MDDFISNFVGNFVGFVGPVGVLVDFIICPDLLAARSDFSENLYFLGFVGPASVLVDFISKSVGFVGPVSVLVFCMLTFVDFVGPVSDLDKHANRHKDQNEHFVGGIQQPPPHER